MTKAITLLAKVTMSGPRNRMEAAYARAHPELEYEAVKLPYVTEHTYTPDFIDPANKTIFETKGRFPQSDRSKMRAVKQQNPEWRIIICFQNPNRTISAKSKTTYAAWCYKNGIEWQHFKY